MKNVLALALVAALSASCSSPAPPDDAVASNESTPVEPSTQLPYDLQAVDFVNLSHGWIVGNDEGNNVSVILRTADGGATWLPAAEVVGDTLLDVDFADERTGWTLGTSGVVYGTTDGGISWNPEPATSWQTQYESDPVQLTAKGPNNIAPIIYESIASVFFVDTKTGWAAGDAPTGTGFDVRGKVLGTTDGGKTWTSIAPTDGPNAPFSINDVWFVSPTEGWAAAGSLEDNQEDVLLHSADGGKNWERRDPKSAQYPRAVHFLDRNRGWLVGLTKDQTTDSPGPSKILATSDGGATWTVQFTSPKSFYDVTFADANRGWAVGDRAAIYATTDGGATWRPQTRFVGKPRRITAARPAAKGRGLRSLFVLDATNVWAGGDGVVLKRVAGSASAPAPVKK